MILPLRSGRHDGPVIFSTGFLLSFSTVSRGQMVEVLHMTYPIGRPGGHWTSSYRTWTWKKNRLSLRENCKLNSWTSCIENSAQGNYSCLWHGTVCLAYATDLIRAFGWKVILCTQIFHFWIRNKSVQQYKQMNQLKVQPTILILSLSVCSACPVCTVLA